MRYETFMGGKREFDSKISTGMKMKMSSVGNRNVNRNSFVSMRKMGIKTLDSLSGRRTFTSSDVSARDNSRTPCLPLIKRTINY